MLFNTIGITSSSLSIPVVSQGTEIFGIPVGSDLLVQDRCIAIAQSGNDLCLQLATHRVRC